MEAGRQFGGALLQGWHAYNITSDPYGIGGWSDEQIAEYLSRGHAPGRGSAAGPMAEAVADSLQYLTADDTGALVAYLRRVQPHAGTPAMQIDPAPAAMTASAAWAPGSRDAKTDLGRRIFEGACASCHSWNGNGRQTDYAALAGSQAVNDPQGVNVVQVLLMGADLRTRHGNRHHAGLRRRVHRRGARRGGELRDRPFRRQGRPGHGRNRATEPGDTTMIRRMGHAE
jgi:mono/diheme cytochrome c family protein